jgi:hypothetical protein
LENMQLELENKKITVSNKELQAIKWKVYFYNFVLPVAFCNFLVWGAFFYFFWNFFTSDVIDFLKQSSSKFIIPIFIFFGIYIGTWLFFLIKYFITRYKLPKLIINNQTVTLHEFILNYEKTKRQQAWFLLIIWLLPLVLFPWIIYLIIKKVRKNTIPKL